MANTFLSMKNIAKTALPILQEMLVFPALTRTDYKETYVNKGDTIQVKRPAVYVADEFGGTINLQDINPYPIFVTMDKLADISVQVTSKELALDIDDFNEDVTRPALVALAEKINRDGLELYKSVPNWVGASGTTPDALEDFANAALKLDVAKAPAMDRHGVWDPYAVAKFRVLDSLVSAEKSGTTEALRRGSIGDVFELTNHMTQAVRTHTAGGYTALADVTAEVLIANNGVDTTSGLKISTATLTSAAGTSTAALVKGDLVEIDGYQYVVMEDTAAAVAGVVSVKIFPQVSANVTAGATVVFPDVTARGHVANMVFNKNAFAYVTRPLHLPTGSAEAAVASFGGLSIRVVKQYDITTKKEVISYDILYGYAPLYPELATRVLG